jgi:hypothetical protein
VRSGYAAAAAVIWLMACGTREPGSSSRPPAPPAPTADSLTLSLAGGISIWFTASRPDSDSAGRSCVERVMEIRRDSLRVPIPLLYTGAAPVRVNDSTVAADLWLHCRPTDRYLVDLRTGRPTRVAR